MATVNRSSEPKTLQSKMGFEDHDLKTPDHDAIMVWLDEHIEEVVAQLVGADKEDWTSQEVEGAFAEANAKITRTRASRYLSDEQREMLAQSCLDIPVFKPLLVGKTRWESPITTRTPYSTYTVGFLDMQVDACSQPAIHLRGWDYPSENLKSSPKFELYYENKWTFLFEVKSAIPSLGELVRQIKYYQTYREGTYVVVSPDQRWQSQLEKQGIRFVFPDMDRTTNQ